MTWTPEKRRAYMRQWRKDNPEKIKLYNAKYSAKVKIKREKKRAYRKEYYLRNRDKMRNYYKEQQAQNPLSRAEYFKKWYLENREKKKKYFKKYNKKRYPLIKEKKAIYDANYRLKQKIKKQSVASVELETSLKS